MSRPLIGVTGRRVRGREIEGTYTAFGELDIDTHIGAYSECVASAGGLPVQLVLGVEPSEVVARLDGLLLTGGADIDPAHYGAAPHPKLGPLEPERDAYELALARAAVDRGLPILGICRGHQLINVALGGTLHQHISGHRGKPTRDGHNVNVEEGSHLATLYGTQATVNSLHHQATDRAGEGLAITARAGDGTVEGAEHESGRILTVQWHPELLQPLEPVFTWLIDRVHNL